MCLTFKNAFSKIFIGCFAVILMKSINPSLRENKRYILVLGGNLKERIEKAVLDFIGILGMAEAGLKFIKINKDSAVIAVNREALNKVRASIAASADNIKIENISGTLKKLK